MHTYSLLALGDSYTIGESVLLHENFPYQAVQLMRAKNYNMLAPEIIAKTGWTTDELDNAMKGYTFLAKYDFVLLLIGVNNQFRGLGVISYKEQLEELLKKAIGLANGKKEHVIIVSIPDYSTTPYAAAMDAEKIAKDIDVFNTVNKALSIQYKVQYLDITAATRELQNDPGSVAPDGLHPAAKTYTLWAEKLTEILVAQLK